MKTTENWMQLSLPDGNKLSVCSDILHHACRYIALAGKYFINEKPDDSHTSAVWIPGNQWLVGQTIETPKGRFKVALNYPRLVLMMVNEALEVANEIELKGKNNTEVFNWLMEQFENLKLDVSGFKNQLHFEIPFHPIDGGAVFDIPFFDYFEELSHYRTNGHRVLEYFATRYDTSEEIRVWPHHFDEGCHIPQKFDDKKVLTSFSIGMAPPDKYYEFPYFFVITWSEKGMDYSKLPPAMSPGAWHTHEWTGEVLSGDKLINMRMDDQREAVYTFMETAIANALELIDRQ